MRKGPLWSRRGRGRTKDQGRHGVEDKRTTNERRVRAGQGSGAPEEAEMGSLRMPPSVCAYVCGGGGYNLEHWLGDVSKLSTAGALGLFMPGVGDRWHRLRYSLS